MHFLIDFKQKAICILMICEAFTFRNEEIDEFMHLYNALGKDSLKTSFNVIFLQLTFTTYVGCIRMKDSFFQFMNLEK